MNGRQWKRERELRSVELMDFASSAGWFCGEDDGSRSFCYLVLNWSFGGFSSVTTG